MGSNHTARSLISAAAATLILAHGSKAQFSSAIVVDGDADHAISLAVADINGDTDPDLVYATRAPSGGIYWRASDGAGNFGPPQEVSVEAYLEELEAVDIDSDGDIDIVCTKDGTQACVVLLRNTGGGTNWVRTIPMTGLVPRTICTLDFDGDGDIDIVSGTGSSPYAGLMWSKNLGGGSFSMVFTPIDPDVDGLKCVRTGDMDGDGDRDIVAAYDYPNEIGWYANTGDVSVLNRQVITNEVLNPMCIDLADLDGDGDLDVLSASHDDGKIAWYANDGVGQFGLQQVLDVAVYSAICVLAADLNSDGLMDIIAPAAGKIVWYKALAPGVFSDAIVAGFNQLTDAAVSDLDQDGDLDLLFTSAGSDLVAWYENYIGSPFEIVGNVFVDEDGSISPTAGDVMLPWLTVVSDPFVSYPMTGDSGSYVFHVVPGTYAVDLPPPGPFWTVEPAGYVASVDSSAMTSEGNDFILTSIIDTSLVSASLTWSPAPCGGVTSVWLSYSNEGTRIEQGNITLQLDSHYVYLSADPPPDSVEEAMLTWTYDSLLYFEVRRIRLEVLKPTSLYQGIPLLSSIHMTALNEMSDTLAAFHFNSQGIHLCAFDPNDKYVIPGGYGEHHAVDVHQSGLDYTIRFQNTGTAPAFNVMLLDSLSPSLDWSSLRLLGYSHTPSSIRIEHDGQLVIQFDNIMLPDSSSNQAGSQGFISFHLNLIPDLPHLTEIANSAQIHFDYNEPVVTNTTLTTLVDCDLWQPQIITLMTNVLQVPEGDGYTWYLNGEPLPGDTSQLLLIDVPGTYTAEVTSEYGCTSATDPVQIIVLEIPEIDALSMAVVPNPFSSETRVLFGEPLTSEHRVELLDLNGRAVRSLFGSGTDQLVLTREGLPAGMYVLRVNSDNGYRGSLRLVIE
ncbi:MAG: T9SS type A sorting domain-containing protein [Flavobacteriales bacterium]